MIPRGYYIGKEKKLTRKLYKTLKRFEPELNARYGNELFAAVQKNAIRHFTRLIPAIPRYQAASYQEIILVNAQLVSIIRAMKDAGKSLEETLQIQATLFKQEFRRIPRFAGRIFVSSIGRFFLQKLARKVTREGWDTGVVAGGPGDDFDVSVVTTQCGVVKYLTSEGMTDMLKYCNMSDFLMFPAMNIGLRQTSTIEKGACTYCMKYRGSTEMPQSLEAIYERRQSPSSEG